MSKRSFLLATIIMLGLFLASCGSSESGEVVPATEASSRETTSNSTSPSTTAQSASTKEPTTASTPSPPALNTSVESVDWRNTRYTTDCQGIAPQPFTVDVKNGQVQSPPDSKYSHGYDVQVEDVVTGDLTGDGKPEVAVELFCGVIDTDISFSYIQVYTDGPSGVQTLAQLKPPDQTECG